MLQIPIIQMHDSCNHETFIVTAGKAYLIDILLRVVPHSHWRVPCAGCRTNESSSVTLSTKVLGICSSLFAFTIVLQ